MYTVYLINYLVNKLRLYFVKTIFFFLPHTSCFLCIYNDILSFQFVEVVPDRSPLTIITLAGRYSSEYQIPSSNPGYIKNDLLQAGGSFLGNINIIHFPCTR